MSALRYPYTEMKVSWIDSIADKYIAFSSFADSVLRDVTGTAQLPIPVYFPTSEGRFSLI